MSKGTLHYTIILLKLLLYLEYKATKNAPPEEDRARCCRLVADDTHDLVLT